MDPAAIRVFISYSHDSPAHQARVLELAHRLRSDGIDARLDRFVVSPAAGWARWMIDEIEAADRVIMVCTPTYRRRCEGREAAGIGNGASFEGLVLLQHLYDHGGQNHDRKLIPVIYPDPSFPNHLDAITPPLRPFSRYALDTEYDALRRDILGLAAITPAPLGVAEVRSPGIDEVRMTAEDALYNLLLSFFGADELRRWIGHHPDLNVIVHDLPGGNASPGKLVTDAIDALDRRCLIDARFFADLRAQRTRRAAEVDAVEGLWRRRPMTSRASAPQPSAQPQPHPQPSIVNNNQSGGFFAPGGIVNNNMSGGLFAPGATFNIKGNFVQGDKNEVHYHGRASDAGRHRLPSGTPVELAPLEPPAGASDFWTLTDDGDGPHAEVVDDSGEVLVLRMHALAFGDCVAGVQGDVMPDESGRTTAGVEVRLPVAVIESITPSVQGDAHEVRLKRPLGYRVAGARWKLM